MCVWVKSEVSGMNRVNIWAKVKIFSVNIEYLLIQKAIQLENMFRAR